MNRAHNRLRAFLGCVALLVSTSTLAQNLIVNGSFETPPTPTGGFLNYPSGSTELTGWTVIGAANGVSTVSGDFNQLCCSFPAQEGGAWLDITGFGTNSNEGIQQVVATTAGASYTLSFYVGNVFDPTGITFGTTSTVQVLINGASMGTFTNNTNAQTQSWQRFSVNFVASGASTTVAFVNADAANDDHNGLDNITLVGGGTAAAPTQLPALSPWAFGALGGLLMLAGLAAQRKKS